MTFPSPFRPGLRVHGYIAPDEFHDEKVVEQFWRRTAANTIEELVLYQSSLQRLPKSNKAFENLTKTVTLLPSLERLIVSGTDEFLSLMLDFLTRQFEENPRWFNIKSFSLYMDLPAVHRQTTHHSHLVSFLLSPAASEFHHLDLRFEFHECEPCLASVLASAVAALSSKKMDTLSIRMEGDESCISAFLQGLNKSSMTIPNLDVSAIFSSRQALLESGLINVFQKPSVKVLGISLRFLGGVLDGPMIRGILRDNQHLSSLHVSVWGEQGLEHANMILPCIAAGLRKNCALKHLGFDGSGDENVDLDLTPITNALVDWSDCPPCLESLVVDAGNYFDSLCELVRHPKCTLKYLRANEYQPFYRNADDDDEDDTESRLEVLLSQKRFLFCMLENTSLASMAFGGGLLGWFVNKRKNLPFKNALQVLVARNNVLHTLAAFANDEHQHVWNVSKLPLSVFPTALERIQKLPENSPNSPLPFIISPQGRTASVLFGFLRQRVDITDMMEHIRRHFVAGETTGAAEQQRRSEQPQPPVQGDAGPAWKKRKILNGTV